MFIKETGKLLLANYFSLRNCAGSQQSLTRQY